MILRKSARGQECMVRYPGVCNHNPETVVLAHFRMHSGMGTKPDDMQGAFCCSACHDEADRRTMVLGMAEARIGFLEGVLRTQQWWRDNGYIKITKSSPP
jgi:Protein of unknown function (DUF1364)